MHSEPQFVDTRVTRTKFDREVSSFLKHSDNYRKEGIICLKVHFPIFEFALFGNQGRFQVNLPPVTLNGNVFIPETIVVNTKAPILLFAIRIDYSNYDVVPPSLRIIDPLTSDLTKAVLYAPVIFPSQQDQNNLVHDQFKVQNQALLLEDNEGKLFVCLRGLREYHLHPDHSGDPWLLHRISNKGSIINILDQLQLYAVSNYNSLLEQQQQIPFNNA